MPTLNKYVEHEFAKDGMLHLEGFGIDGQGEALFKSEQAAMFEGLIKCRTEFKNSRCQVQVRDMKVSVSGTVHYAPESDINDFDSNSRQSFTVSKVEQNPFGGTLERKVFDGWICDPWIRRRPLV